VRARTVVVDANVLFSIELTDLLLTFATRRLLQIRWSEDILSEVRRSLEVSGRLPTAAIDRRLAAMQRALPDATAEAPRALVDQMRVEANDRHVLALAVAVGADAIITFNVRDFPADYCMSLGIEVLTPDDLAVETLRGDSFGDSFLSDVIAGMYATYANLASSQRRQRVFRLLHSGASASCRLHDGSIPPGPKARMARTL